MVSARLSQGWKIHVSAAAVEAPALAATVVPALVSLAAAFKIARRLDDVVYLNSGDAGPAQVGKIVTVYPRDDAHAAAIALRLDAIWPSSRGPEVRTDRHLRPGSPVSLRFGAFGGGPTIVTSGGIHEYAVTTAAWAYR